MCAEQMAGGQARSGPGYVADCDAVNLLVYIRLYIYIF